jgi:molybdopterin-containing oxidoreductase family membrane subunit
MANTKVKYRAIEGNSKGYLVLLGVLALLAAIGVLSAHHMETEGHVITGMNNQIVWGLPHVFAVFLIVAASGALNIASISSVFKRPTYKPMARLSGITAIALLAGGLMVLVLDLGRPDRLLVTVTHINLKSIFTWNILLYSGFFAVVAVYIWMMMERKMNRFSRPAGIAAFIWRLILTTGTGSIFGFLVARQGYDAAIYAPMFIIMSFSFGLAIFILILFAAYKYTDRQLGDKVVTTLTNLLGVFVASVLFFVTVYHLTNLYATEHHGWEGFILAGKHGGGPYAAIFWIFQIIIGSLIPLALIFSGYIANNRKLIALTAGLVIVGGVAQIYVTIIGGQAFPLVLFPQAEVSSTFFDGIVGTYSPSIWELLLGIGGVATALAIVTFAIKILPFLPESLADAVVDPHHTK